MSYTVKYSIQFLKDFDHFPEDQVLKIAKFASVFQQHGLADQTKFEGRVSPSWMNLPTNHPDYQYTLSRHLWHYHIGIPQYSGMQQWNRTSDWVLHFQWPQRGPTVWLVDVYAHHTSSGAFYLPPPTALADQEETDPS
ncbi:hypothetical protein [Comamonas sp. B21-038]|uniref:hypothetical protein n=1 Tax=Comamonas sp. B21-038 TaxID=2918299 RepID=UPI001EFB7698|nr:hypothetical protein [Comamonas sp. B21-038]ULR87386.1 hypothetical protein MJ205_13015 [Comamonas sp. B21-038]